MTASKRAFLRRAAALQPLAAMSKAYADGTAQFRAIAKSIDLQAQ